MNEPCVICGRPSTCDHHLIFGRGLRQLADEDGLKIRLCDSCHNMHIMKVARIHDNDMAEALSRIVGQLMYELKEVEGGSSIEEAEVKFRERYGKRFI